MIPITVVRIGPDEEALVLEVLRSGQLAQGAYVERFEQQFANVHGVAHAVAVNNGTTALVAAMQAHEIGPGDEVITSPFTFVATLNAILEAGATARFADINDDYNVDAAAMAALVNDRTRVLLPVHLYGCMADMPAIEAVAADEDLVIIEDAAQAVGATCHGRPAGSFGTGCFSLYATKNLSTGEGGMITTDDDRIADRLRLLRNQGMRARYQYELPGHNYRLTNLSAAVGIPQLDRLTEMTEARRKNAAALRAGLSGIDGLLLPPEPADGWDHVYHQFTVRVTPDARLDRDTAVDRIVAGGVGAGVYYPSTVFDYECYRAHPNVVLDDVPRATEIASQVLSLPIHQHLSDADVDTIIETVGAVFSS
ncbi:MAG: DegT/DnrJ/EryC1/StrS family aminotransferase [Ilumatobacter sp.]|nr:DegT/DnrJ/EryC1/StrS family aminotransferase [Ilumatobacter sp.]